MKPPALTIPVARPIEASGFVVRDASNPINVAGPHR